MLCCEENAQGVKLLNSGLYDEALNVEMRSEREQGWAAQAVRRFKQALMHEPTSERHLAAEKQCDVDVGVTSSGCRFRS